jgi:hypothetical protein
MEVVEWNGGRWLRMSDDQNLFVVTPPEALPQRFTLEFDYSNPAGYGWGGLIVSFDGKHPYHRADGSRLRCNYDNAGLDARSGQTPQPPTAMKRLGGELQDQMYRCRVMVDGDYAKAYVNDTRVANLPNGAFPRGRQIAFYTAIHGQKPRCSATCASPPAAGSCTTRSPSRGAWPRRGSTSTRARTASVPRARRRSRRSRACSPSTRSSGSRSRGTPTTWARRRATSPSPSSAPRPYARRSSRSSGWTPRGWPRGGSGRRSRRTANDTPEGRQQNRRVELVKM